MAGLDDLDSQVDEWGQALLTHRDPNRAALLARNSPSNPTLASSSRLVKQNPYQQQPCSDHHIPSYGRSYGDNPSGSFPPSRPGSAFSQHRTAEALESQNDEALEGLSAKVRLLKEITVNIGTEVKDSSKLISTMNDTFSEATGMLAGTFRRMNAMSARQGGRWWYCPFSVSHQSTPPIFLLTLQLLFIGLLFLVIVFWVFVFTWL
ncbi:hypothetical protein CROQUDRAFT_97993 [Cronartium quercuum f. sp. fusiforme G11]|uniref:t-SNARE coiled-coil homology domain-containing protein n=1 Tax=Cronartium quercuum f. sp. fusiforme G11 TaxID=708437 RepID=A0A9P6T917_9BASI|nr:hypothetical protein CROQUDRAFT_97993 [Cronartium quercuum f. sp. fusiforme G11]